MGNNAYSRSISGAGEINEMNMYVGRLILYIYVHMYVSL